MSNLNISVGNIKSCQLRFKAFDTYDIFIKNIVVFHYLMYIIYI